MGKTTRRIRARYRSRSVALKKANQLRWQYNLIGLLVLLLIVILATDAGGISHWLGTVLGR